MRETRFIIAEDGLEVAVDWYKSERQNSATGVVLVHMMPETRRSFREVGAALQKNGCSALAIDLRGHGDSLKAPDGTPLDYRNFSDEMHQAGVRDVRAGVLFLRAQGARDVFLIGASIGANLALRVLAEDASIRGAVLLSPGYNYRGVEAKRFVEKLHSGQSVLFVGSRDDTRGTGDTAADMAQGLADAVPHGVLQEVKIFDSAGHGTDILKSHPEYIHDIIHWVCHE